MDNITGKVHRATMEFSLLWQSVFGHHRDRRYVEKVDFWRDILPGTLQQNISSLSPGEKYLETFSRGVLVPDYSDKNIIEFSKNLFARKKDGRVLSPEPGRFYPKGYAWRALHSFPDGATPFRLMAKTDKTLVADTNHPLAGFSAAIEATMVERLNVVNQRGGSASDIADLLTRDGPGMQLPGGGLSRDTYREYPFRRNNEEDDRDFYRSPRFVHHLDSTARSHVQEIYSRFLSSGMEVLDLMSSWESHLPENLQHCQVTGVGLNMEEMARNEQLSAHTIHDLNKNPLLPFEGSNFDAVICTASIEYLTCPREVMKEVARTLRSGGIFIVIVSDRWFPGKEILPWAELHSFERQGLVLQYFLQANAFDELRTESLRGYPRPADDKYSDQLPYSDPLFIVSGRKP